jgi:hypothetical protein
MHVEQLSISNYRSFHGEHIYRFQRGINIVSGGPGSGKTSLCSAIEFALFGGVSKDESIINRQRVEEAKTECLWAGSEAQLLFMEDNVEHRADREFSLSDEEEVIEKAYYSKRLSSRLDRNLFREAVYIGELPPHASRSSAESVEEYLLALAKRSAAGGLGLMILDDVLGRLPQDNVEKMLSRLIGSGLDQVILLSPEPYRGFDGAKHFCLGDPVESVTFKVMGFPFEPSRLRREIECTIRNSYVAKGDVFRENVYGQEYTMEAAEVEPDGARYLVEKSSLNIIGENEISLT